MKFSLIETALSILLKAVGAMSLLFMNLAVINTYGSYDSGAFFTYLSVLFIISSFIRHGTDTFTVKYLSNPDNSNTDNRSSAYFYSRLYAISKLYALCVIVFVIISQFWELNFDKIYFVAVYFHALIFFFSFYLQSQFFYKLAVLFNSILVPLFFILTLAFFSNNINVYLAYAISCFGVFLLALLILKFHLKLPLTFELNAFLNKGSYSYKLFWLVSMLNILVQWSPVFFAGMLMSSLDSTIFTVAHRVAMVISFFLIAINAYVVPHYAKLSGEAQREKLQEFVSKIATLLAFMSILSCLLIFLLIISDIYDFELDSNYAMFKVILPLLCLGQLFSAIIGSVGYLLQLTNLVKFYVFSISTSLILMFVSYTALYIAGSLSLYNFSCITALGVIIQNALAWLFLMKKASINTLSYKWPL